MCNMYKLQTMNAELAQWADVTQGVFEFTEYTAPKKFGLGLWSNAAGNREIVPMRFGLIPASAKSAHQYKPPYNNARVENLSGWPWKMSVKRRRCIVPLTSYIEYSYWGHHPGHKLEFQSREHPILGVAGIYHHFQNGTDDIVSMTMLTRPASSEVMDWGHHRMPLFMAPEGFDAWMQGTHDIDKCHQEIVRHAMEPEFDVEVGDAMKAGWQKRVDKALVKRDEQRAAIQRDGPFGVGLES